MGRRHELGEGEPVGVIVEAVAVGARPQHHVEQALGQRQVCDAFLRLGRVEVGAGGAGTHGGSEQAASSEADAASACLDETVDAIQARYETVRDFAARFEQTTRPARLGASPVQKIISRGRVVVAKPARMRWSYESPEPSVVVSDGETLWIYDPVFREAQRLRASEGYFNNSSVILLFSAG